MRSLIKSLEKHSELTVPPVNGAFSSAPNGGLGGPNEPHNDFGGPIDPSQIKQEPGINNNGNRSSFHDFSAFSATVLDAGTKVKKRKHKAKTSDELEIVVESSSSDSEREDLRRVKKPKPAIDTKVLNTHSVTITPITSGSVPPILPGMGLERRPGIEIIPITTPSNSITITPITGGDKEVKKNRNLDDREKRRKRKREEDSKMGPPEKVPTKSDPLSKPVSVSIKPATDSPPATRPNSPSMRKYTSSPTQFRDKSSTKSNPSPKHSPVYTSPKHSPKHGTNSPKQGSSGSGKPSMSTLKASNSPTPKNSEAKKVSSGKEARDRDPARKSGSASSPKIKSSSVKLKQLELGTADISVTNISSPADPKCQGNPLQRNRKGSLSAVIDKLKSAQEVGDPLPKDKITITNAGTSITKIESKPSISIKAPEGVKNPTEYMVKPSSDGMKITINKTRSKESSKSSSSKTHTGLKPGVVSGPASKKPSVPPKISGTPKVSSLPGNSKPGIVKPLVKPISKSSGSPKLPTDLSRKDPLKQRPVKTEKSIFKEGQRKGSPTPAEDVLKGLKLDSGLPASLSKPFDTKFQIPKLSARNNPSSTSSDVSVISESAEVANNNNNITKSEKTTEKSDIKVIDVGTPKASLELAANLKYQSDRLTKTPNTLVPNLLSLPIALTNISPKLPMTSPNLPTTSMSSITSKLDKQEDIDPSHTDIKAVEAKTDLVKSETASEEKPKSVESKHLSPETKEILLDFSNSQGLQAKLAVVDKVIEKVGPGSPLLVVPSPRTPSAIDDDLMDEALMLRK